MPKKTPRLGAPFHPVSKVPRFGDRPEVQGMDFCWRVSDLDWHGPWGWSQANCEELLKYIVPRLPDLESMKWGDVEGKTGSHFVEATAITSQARHRLVEIGKDEQARLFSLRITGEKRLWGIRDIAILRLLWWDPRHEVCPSPKKNT
jgi:hypothetical protein